VTEHTARSFAEQYRVDVSTARQYLKNLVKEGKATAVKKPVRIGFNEKEVVTKRMVTTYRLK
jgi:ribosomal protein S25